MLRNDSTQDLQSILATASVACENCSFASPLRVAGTLRPGGLEGIRRARKDAPARHWGTQLQRSPNCVRIRSAHLVETVCAICQDQLWRIQRLCDERLQGFADKIRSVCGDIVGDEALTALQAASGYGKLANQRLKDVIEETVVRYKEKEINSYIRRVAALEASEEHLRRELEEKDIQANKSIERIVGSNNVGLRTIMREVHELQATSAHQGAEIARLSKDCEHYKKRYEQAMEESSQFHEDLLKASAKEAALEEKSRGLESQVSQLKCDLADTKTCLEESEKRRTAIDLRSQQLETRLEDYMDREAKKHQEIVQMMDKKMSIATLRISQYRDQRQKLINELRRGKQRTEQLDKHLQEKTRTVEELKCQVDVKDCELQQLRSVAEHEKTHLDVHLQQLTQEARAARAECAVKETALDETRKELNAVKALNQQLNQELECLRTDHEVREGELLCMRKALDHQKTQVDALLQERAQAIETHRAALEIKDGEVQQLRKRLDHQKTETEQELLKHQQEVESLRHANDLKEKETGHLRKLLEQQKRDWETDMRQKDHDIEIKQQELQRARETAEKKQVQLDATVQESEQKESVIAELRASVSELKRRCEELVSSHRFEVERVNEDFHRELTAKLREKEEEKDFDLRRKLEDAREEIRKSESEATEMQRRKAAADLKRMQTMIVTLTNQNRGLVKQCKLLASKLEESTGNIEKLKDALQVEKCKLLESSEKARDAGLLRQRVAVLERSVSDNKQQTQNLVVERNSLKEDRDRLDSEAQSLKRRCSALLENCDTLESRVAGLESEVVTCTQQLRERGNDISLLQEEIRARAEEAMIYKDNLKVIWSSVVEHLPVRERDQEEICVSQRMSPSAVRMVHALLSDAVDEACARAVDKIASVKYNNRFLASAPHNMHFAIATPPALFNCSADEKVKTAQAEAAQMKQEKLAEQRMRTSFEERLRAKEKEGAKLDIALALANEKLLASEQELCMYTASKTQMQEKLRTLEQALDEALKEKTVLTKRTEGLEQELAAIADSKSEIHSRLGMRENELVNICKERMEIEERLKSYERELDSLKTENARLEAKATANQRALLTERQKNEDMQALALELERKCRNTKKECEVLLEANKTNSANLMKQSARKFQSEMQALQLRHREELETREVESRRLLNSRIEQLAAETARQQERLMAEAEATRRDQQTEIQLLR
ncbi:putative myosin heavy chain [Neospora caninum Liverpool]|nr:putative myosin heavy chain [Neospora caninum Liverpool]CBZ54336.1 putative myosin heavy chain [Neospora caninum Liverpool]|eukprot:XP_003884367.1 putative myosin heavy chain [Neospora caninum Liverpool]